ncbi:MAG: hypothetical protein IKM04_00975 [Clostridia bacterium]|nr:hypothetical protein [Clostridia bacterium]
MKNSQGKPLFELAAEIMPDGLTKERSGMHGDRFYNLRKTLKKTSKEEIFAKNGDRKSETDFN